MSDIEVLVNQSTINVSVVEDEILLVAESDNSFSIIISSGEITATVELSPVQVTVSDINHSVYVDEATNEIAVTLVGTMGPAGTAGPPGPPATQVPRLIQEFDTDASTAPGDPCYLSGANFVSKITSNSTSQIPDGVFGIIYYKPTTIRAEVLFIGIKDGFTGLTAPQPVHLQNDGSIAHGVPARVSLPDITQRLGFAISATEIMFNPLPPGVRNP